MKQLTLFPELTVSAYPKTRLQAIVYFMAKLDAEMIDDLLENDKTYQDFPKHVFMHKLMLAFEQFEEQQQNELKTYKGWCSGCSIGCSGYTFLAKNGMYMDVLFKTNGNEIEDIYQCYSLVNENRKIKKNKKKSVRIDLILDSDGEESPF